MPVTVEYLPQKQTVAIVATGAITADELGCQSPRTIELLHQHDALRMLVDYRDAQIEVSTMDVYALPDRYDTLGLSRKVRIAVVLPRDLENSELFDFYEDVTHNRGFMTRLFRSPDEAQRWLEVEE
jgi:hypothetical protein